MRRSEIESPLWVQEANRRLSRRRRPVVVDDWPATPEVGEVRVADTTEDGDVRPRLVCVLSVDRRVGAARVALVSNEIEMTWEGDVVVPGSGCGLPFGVLVEARVTGSLWWIQIGRKVGRLDDRWTDTVRRAVHAVGKTATRASRAGEGSPRAVLREFQRVEAARLRTAAARCEAAATRAVRDVPVVVDPRLFAGGRNEETALRPQRLLQVARELEGSRIAAVPREGVGAVMAACEALPGLGPDLAAALRPLLEGALSDLGGGSAERGVEFEPRGCRDPGGADGRLAAALERLGTADHGSIRLVTDRGSWVDEAGEDPDPVAVRCGGRGRIQIVRNFLEVHP